MPVSTTLQKQVFSADVMSMIFRAAVSDWESTDPVSPHGIRHHWAALAVLLRKIMSVCYEWRDIAICSPRLWRNVLCCDDAMVYFSLSLCLERSGIIPLHVWIFGSASLVEAHRVLAAHPLVPLTRVQSLCVVDNDIDNTDLLLDELEELRVICHPVLVNTTRPGLLRLCLCLAVSHISAYHLDRVLRAHPSLEYLDILDDTVRLSDYHTRPEVVPLPHLQYLSISETSIQHAGFYLYLIDCPELEVLTFAVDQDPSLIWEDPPPPSRMFLYSSNPNPIPSVRTLILGGLNNCDDIADLLTIVPNARDLRLFTISNHSPDLHIKDIESSNLVDRLRNEAILPALTTVHLYYPSAPAYFAIVNAMFARYTTPHSEPLCLYFPYEDHEIHLLALPKHRPFKLVTWLEYHRTYQRAH